MSGPNFSQFGDVIASCLQYSPPKDATADLNKNFCIYMGQVIAIYPIGDSSVTEQELQKFVLYDVQIIHPDGTQEIIPYCRASQPLFGGGLNNFLETLQTDPGPDAKKKTLSMKDRRAHWVLVAFISGIKNSGVIIGAMPHANPTAVSKRPNKAKGVYTEGEIQGLNFSVDNDGAFTLSFNGPRKDDGSLEGKNGPTVINIDKDGKVKVSTNANQSVAIDRVAKTITITDGENYIKSDQGGGKIQVVAKVVEVGTGALQPQVVGDDMVEWLKDLVDAITQIYVPTGVGPSGTPVNAPMFKQLASKLKDKILSKKHKVEK